LSPLPSKVGRDQCRLEQKWKVEPLLARMIIGLDQWAESKFLQEEIPWPGLTIISGFRTRSHQLALNPSAPNSLHTRCPAQAVDLRVGTVPVPTDKDAIWPWLGARWIQLGGRWGGMFSTPDVNHFDLGV